ncbi:ribosomal protein S15 [Mactra antiquata]
MSLSRIIKPKIRDVALLCQSFCNLNVTTTRSALPSRCIPLLDQSVRCKSIDVSHLKPLNFDYGGDLVKQEPLDLSEIVFKYRDIPEVHTLPDHVKRLFTLDCATSLERLEHRNAVVLEEVTKLVGPGNTVEKQICYLTIKIRNLIPYIVQERRNKKHKDYLVKTIEKRKKMLRKLRRIDYDRFVWLLRYLQITFQEDKPYTYWKLGRYAVQKSDARQEAYQEGRQKFLEVQKRFEEEKTEYIKEKEKVLNEIDADIKHYNLGKVEVLKAYEKYVNARREKFLEGQVKVSRTTRVKRLIKEQRLKNSRIF